MQERVKLSLRREQGRPQAIEWGLAESRPEVHQSGFKGWLAHKAEHFKTRWHNARGGLTGKMHKMWDWLHRRTPADEPLLSRFRKANRIEVFHHESLNSEEARELWGDYLKRRKRRHLPRFVLNLIVSPLTILLAPLPGPNLIGYWFAYRSIRHLLILYGLRRARTSQMEVSFHPVGEDELHEPQGPRSGHPDFVSGVSDIPLTHEPKNGSPSTSSHRDTIHTDSAS